MNNEENIIRYFNLYRLADEITAAAIQGDRISVNQLALSYRVLRDARCNFVSRNLTSPVKFKLILFQVI